MQAQSSSVSGSVMDPSGAAIPSATVSLTNLGNAVTRSSVTDKQGHYQFNQVAPGTYKIVATATGFGQAVADNVKLLVDTPAIIDLPFTSLTAAVTQVEVVAGGGAEINTTDASLGNVVDNKPIVQLPLEGRNVTGLLALQPGVTFIKEPNPGALNDYRSGAVNGGKADQANVLLDGVDVNDQQNRASFTSVLRVTPDSIQEFRTITANPGAELGHSSGAQVTLVTKGGTNVIHGSAYEYNRNTALEANTFLNKQATPVLTRPALVRNVFGASGGGPLWRDKLFIFGAYEGRRDASATAQNRTVPTCDFRAGNVSYKSSTGTKVLSPDDVKALDPQGIGESAAAVHDMQLYPGGPGCEASGQTGGIISGTGDGYNTITYTFNAKTPLKYNTYTSRVDWDLNSKHQIYWRGNLQGDNYASGAPQFDAYGDGTSSPPSGVYVNFSKGFAAGYTWTVSQNIVNMLRAGFTRQSAGTSGTLKSAYSYFDGITPLYNTSTTTVQQLPIWDVRDDVTWVKGKNNIGFGGEIFLLHNNIQSNSSSFSYAFMDGLYLAGDGAVLTPADFTGGITTYALQVDNIMGLESKLYRYSNYDLAGNVLPDGTMINRTFFEKHFDLYLQDSWKATPHLTLTAGIRWTNSPPIYEVNGYNVLPSIPTGEFLAKRGALAASGASQDAIGTLSYELASTLHKGLYATQNDWAPRVSFAYTPHSESGPLSAILGSDGKTSIRGGFGLFYDAFGEGLAKQFSTSAGFSTHANNGPGQQIANVPRYTGFYDMPWDSSLLPAAPAGGFPQANPVGAMTQSSSVDPGIRSPYSFAENLSIARELKGGFLFQISWVGRQSRRSLTGEDTAQPTDLVDPASGMDWNTAAKLMGEAANSGAATVSPIPFFENLWPTAAGDGKTATQNIYVNAYFKDDPNDYTTPQTEIDAYCGGTGELPCSKLGQYAMWNSQYISLHSFRSVGAGDYNAMQALLRKSFRDGYQFDFNYTLSKCLDLGSTPESSGTGSTGSIQNAWNPSQMHAVCDYDLHHQVSAMVVAELPIGKGKMLLGNAGKALNEVVGGWQLSSIYRQTSGFPGSVSNGNGYPTQWDYTGLATLTGKLPGRGKKGYLFSDSAAAYAAFSPTWAGQSGSRNVLRGDGLITFDAGLSKRFELFSIKDHPHTLQFRFEGFNLTNTARFDIQTAALKFGTPNGFGKYGGPGQLVDPRVFQAALRYEF